MDPAERQLPASSPFCAAPASETKYKPGELDDAPFGWKLPSCLRCSYHQCPCHSERTGPRTLFSSGVVSEESAFVLRQLNSELQTRDTGSREPAIPPLYSYIDVNNRLKETQSSLAGLLLLLCLALAFAQVPARLHAQAAPAPAGPPPSSGGFFPLSEVHRGLKATAWTVFTGTAPEAMDVEILGVLRGGRGPGHDMILVQLHGAHPEYTGVVAGMSGSPVYVGNRLLGSLSYRIGQFSKDPIAGVTPIEQMLEVRDLPMRDEGTGIRDQPPKPITENGLCRPLAERPSRPWRRPW